MIFSNHSTATNKKESQSFCLAILFHFYNTFAKNSRKRGFFGLVKNS